MPLLDEILLRLGPHRALVLDGDGRAVDVSPAPRRIRLRAEPAEVVDLAAFKRRRGRQA